MTVEQYTSELDVTQARLMQLEQQMQLMNHRFTTQEQEQQRQVARSSMADFLGRVERNQHGA